jgi:competence protein ComFB
VEATVSAPSGKELNYKTKLKIEIEPEIEIKEPPKARGPAKAGGSGRPGTAEAAGAEAAGRGAAEAPPDGTPYERIGKERLPDYSLELAAQRESIRDAGARRTKKIEIESSLISASRLVNLSELLTKELLPSVMERMEMCTCPMCTTNVLALTLNALPPKYVTSDEGKQYTQLEVYKSQYELDVLAAMTKACLRVKSSPRHEIIDDGIDRQ